MELRSDKLEVEGIAAKVEKDSVSSLYTGVGMKIYPACSPDIDITRTEGVVDKAHIDTHDCEWRSRCSNKLRIQGFLKGRLGAVPREEGCSLYYFVTAQTQVGPQGSKEKQTPHFLRLGNR